MLPLPKLVAGDCVEVIAPASRCPRNELDALIALLKSWDLECHTNPDIFGDDLLCANSDDARFHALKNALQRTETKAIICARGGYGSMRLIPRLAQVLPPSSPKLFVGMSDITALNLFLQQRWQWPIVHGAIAPNRFSGESLALSKSFLFAEVEQIEFHGIALNDAARKSNVINAVSTGGNLSLIQASIGTLWQMEAKDKIIFIEEVGERGYRIDRMFEHLNQSHIFDDAKAIVFADFLGGDEPNGSSLIKPVLQRFADQTNLPVVQIAGVGHGNTNFPVPLGTLCSLMLGNDIKVICKR